MKSNHIERHQPFSKLLAMLFVLYKSELTYGLLEVQCSFPLYPVPVAERLPFPMTASELSLELLTVRAIVPSENVITYEPLNAKDAFPLAYEPERVPLSPLNVAEPEAEVPLTVSVS